MSFWRVIFFYIYNVIYCFLIYLVVVFEVFRRVFLVGIFCIFFFFINIYYILCYLCLYCAILCSKWATVNYHLRQNQKKGKCETDKLSWSQYWSNWRYITFLETFRKEAEIRNDPVNNLLKYYWCAGPRSGYHRRWYQTCTSKGNLKNPLKRKMDDNVKVPVTSKPDKLPRAYDR